MADVLEEILERICAAEEQIVAGSVAYPDFFITTGDSLYWANKLEYATPEQINGTRNALYTMRLTAVLHRGKQTEALTNGGLEALCRKDMRDVARFFASERSFVSTAFPTRHGNIVPNSALYQSGQVAQIASSDQTLQIGTVHVITFAYRE